MIFVFTEDHCCKDNPLKETDHKSGKMPLAYFTRSLVCLQMQLEYYFLACVSPYFTTTTTGHIHHGAVLCTVAMDQKG